jgi:hypothetical protein
MIGTHRINNNCNMKQQVQQPSCGRWECGATQASQRVHGGAMHCNISGPVAEPHNRYSESMAEPYHVALEHLRGATQASQGVHAEPCTAAFVDPWWIHAREH